MEIEGKVAVVTGGASGIGRATVEALIERGARVVVADIDPAGEQLVADLWSGSAVFTPCDVTKSGDIEAALKLAREHFGRLDIVYNNAGINADEPLFEDDAGTWRRVVDINLTAVIDGTRLAVRALQEGRGGAVINTASMGGLLPMPGSPVYAASKAGVVNFTRSLSYLAEEANIRVNAVCPTYTDTPLVRRSGEERMKEAMEAVGGILQPQDVAAGVIELIEDDSRAGAIMRVTVRGGRDYARDVRP